MWNKVADAITGMDETWLTAGGFVIGMLIGGLILMASIKSARRGYEDDLPAEWDGQEDEEAEDGKDEKGEQGVNDGRK